MYKPHPMAIGFYRNINCKTIAYKTRYRLLSPIGGVYLCSDHLSTSLDGYGIDPETRSPQAKLHNGVYQTHARTSDGILNVLWYPLDDFFVCKKCGYIVIDEEAEDPFELLEYDFCDNLDDALRYVECFTNGYKDFTFKTKIGWGEHVETREIRKQIPKKTLRKVICSTCEKGSRYNHPNRYYCNK